MALTLRDVPASDGLLWLRQGLAETLRQPLSYASLFVLFMFGAMLLTVVPVVGGPLLMMAVPLLSLAFMMAAAGAQRGLRVQPAVYLAPWQQKHVPRKRALLSLCMLYALATLAVLALGDLLDHGRFDDLLAALTRGDATPEEIQTLLAEPGLLAGALARTLGSALLSLPFWHAPALVHWEGQRPAQALFSSLLAIWRTRGAFTLYSLGWLGVTAGAGLACSLLLAITGMGPTAAALLVTPIALFLTTAFYVSLFFVFTGSFTRSTD
jgi:hypothetical protein